MHTAGCLWERDSRNGCACHQPTVWGSAYLYTCDCCEQPRAPRQYVLCDECERHQDQAQFLVDVIHANMSDDDGLDPAPAGVGSRSLYAQTFRSGVVR